MDELDQIETDIMTLQSSVSLFQGDHTTDESKELSSDLEGMISLIADILKNMVTVIDDKQDKFSQ